MIHRFCREETCIIWSAVALHIDSLLISSLFPKILGCRCLLESWGLLLRLCYIFGSSKSCWKVLLVPTDSRIIAQQFCVSVPLPTKIVEFVFGTPGREMWDYNGKFYQHILKVAIWAEETLSSDNILVSHTVYFSLSRIFFCFQSKYLKYMEYKGCSILLWNLGILAHTSLIFICT